MTPNLLVLGQKVLRPHRWFDRRSPHRQQVEVEHRQTPVPGTYEFRPGRGWYLVATDDDEGARLAHPVAVKYSRVLRRNLLQPDYDLRKRQGRYKDANGRIREAGFFCVDDGIGYVKYLDFHGDFIPGPYKMWCLDHETGLFRDMLKGDDPAWHSRHSSRSNSSTHTPRVSGESQRRPPLRAITSSNASSITGETTSRSASVEDFSPTDAYPSITRATTVSQPSTRQNSLLNLTESIYSNGTAPTTMSTVSTREGHSWDDPIDVGPSACRTNSV
jgi:hypothetical protein